MRKRETTQNCTGEHLHQQGKLLFSCNTNLSRSRLDEQVNLLLRNNTARKNSVFYKDLSMLINLLLVLSCFGPAFRYLLQTLYSSLCPFPPEIKTSVSRFFLEGLGGHLSIDGILRT